MSESDLLKKVVSLHQSGSVSAAEKHCLRALKKYPESYNLRHFLGVMYLQGMNIKKALGAFELALELRSDDANLLHNIGLCHLHGQQYKKAVKYLRRAIAMESNPVFYKHLALACAQGEDEETAEEVFQQYVTQVDSAEAWTDYGSFLRGQSRYEASENALKRAVSLAPQAFSAQQELTDLYMDWLRFDLLYEQHARSVALSGESVYYSAYLFALNYKPGLSGEELFSYYQRYNEKYAVPADQRCDHVPNPQVAEAPIRLAYLSANAYSHTSVSRFLLPLLENHDKTRFEIYMYSVDTSEVADMLRIEHSANRASKLHELLQKSARDAGRKEYKRLSHRWVDVTRMSDRELVRQICRDKIDILVDLMGHTKGERLRALSYKPAPVMVTWLGFGHTTGLEVMDYFFSDAEFTPQGCDALYSEELYRLSRPPATYQPGADMPAVGPLPARANGYITFACFSRAIRFNPPLLECWAELLLKVPHSRLVLNTSHFGIAANRRIFREDFARLGIEEERLILLDTTAPATWDEYNKIDIALDTFPHNAGTTTFDALWMGVPVLSLEGGFAIQRFSSMILRPLGLERWITASPQAYIERGVELAGNVDALEVLRGELRERLRSSVFTDYAGLAREVERAYTDMYQRFQNRAG